MTTLGHDYQSVIGEMVGFQRNMIAQDQFMQILIQYLVNLEAGELSLNLSSRWHQIDRLSWASDHKATTTGTSPNSSAPFAPSASAQKLISAYNDLSRASYDQMANLSRRASLSNGALPQIPLPPSTFGRLDVGPSDRFRESSMASTDSRYRETDRFNDSNGNHDNLHQNHNRNRNGMGSGSGLVLPSLGGLESAVQQHQREAQAREYYQREQHRIQQNEQQRQHDQRRQYDQQQRQQQQQHQHQNQQQHQQHQSQHLRPQQQQQPHQQNDRQQHEQQLRVASPANVDHPPLTISLPVVDRKPVLVAGWAVPPRVLLVEDDAVCRKLSAKFLEIFGCEIDVAVDGVSAVNKMNLERYDLVLMVSWLFTHFCERNLNHFALLPIGQDIVMPNLDGKLSFMTICQV
jgi:osomolarity two-component system response regulator SKN7